MARAGLGPDWTCLFANDFDPKKASRTTSIGVPTFSRPPTCAIKAPELPGCADLAWASFPCQDLSLAGAGAGLKGDRSGTFWPFWDVINGLIAAKRAPKLIVVENVVAPLPRTTAKTLPPFCATFAHAGYRFGALVIDAKHFLPQSRPRLFIVGIRADLPLRDGIAAQEPSDLWHPRALRTAHAALPTKSRAQWLWWSLPTPPKRRKNFADLIEANPKGVSWHTPAQTDALLAMMSDSIAPRSRPRKKSGRRMVGGVYKRTRRDSFGGKAQRAEVRFDDIAGCLRTPAGGSSRQTIILIDGPEVRTRLLSPREAARLMGLADKYKLPNNYNEAYHLIGDGLAVPVVRHLARHILSPVLASATEWQKRAAA